MKKGAHSANKGLKVHFATPGHFEDFAKRTDLPITKKTRHITLHSEDVEAFARVLSGQTITEKTRYVWYPKAKIIVCADKRYVQADGKPMTPRYPVYVISKGRADTRYTSKALDKMGVPYHIIVEPQEYEQYKAVIDPTKIIRAPEDFSKRGQGSIPVRNFVWEHSIALGAARHWILDDNIRGFFRFNHNKKVRVADGTIFKCAEDFVDRYENVALAGFHYTMFVKNKWAPVHPFLWNTRIYSCTLIKNDIENVNGEPFRWRGRYNEDTDLSLRVLKDGWNLSPHEPGRWCTVLFHAFLADKATTMTMNGGNTDELYKDDGRLKMAQSLCKQHPDVSRITWRFGRWQHLVNYKPFKKNRPKYKPGIVIPQGVNNYGMKLVEIGRSRPATAHRGGSKPTA